MDSKDAHRRIRIVSLVAATVISLASGTNYAYSAWEPQLAERLRLTATEGELVGAFGNLGMYATGIPFGILVDQKGPRPSAIVGSICLIAGYLPIHMAYDRGIDGMSVSLLCFFSFLTGMGSCSSFQAALKTAALNWPQHRGTATAFPLAAFGLSAFFFSAASSIAFPNNTSGFLLLLAIGTSAMVFISVFFLQIVHPQSDYSALPTQENHARSGSRETFEMQTPGAKRPSRHAASESELDGASSTLGEDDDESSEVSSPGDIFHEENEKSGRSKNSHWADSSGLSLLIKQEFWQLWIQMALLSGVGLMTINNIGNDTMALWKHYDETVPEASILKAQKFQVSALSLMSFVGRLSSGISSDILVKRLHASRFWCATAAGVVFAFAQILAMNIEDPHHLWILSCLSGLGYGFLFGVMPALVADSFGANNLSVNWGFITLAPVVSGNIFNLWYGAILDKHSHIMEDGEHECESGLVCYSNAYFVTFFASLAGIAVSLWGVRQQHLARKRWEQVRHDTHRDA